MAAAPRFGPIRQAGTGYFIRRENKLGASPRAPSPVSVNKAVSGKRKAARGTGHDQERCGEQARRGLATITVRAQSEWQRSVTQPGKQPVCLEPAWARSSRASGQAGAVGALQTGASSGRPVSSVRPEVGNLGVPSVPLLTVILIK